MTFSNTSLPQDSGPNGKWTEGNTFIRDSSKFIQFSYYKVTELSFFEKHVCLF